VPFLFRVRDKFTTNLTLQSKFSSVVVVFSDSKRGIKCLPLDNWYRYYCLRTVVTVWSH
jgi:hypothetical protein